MRKVRYLIWNLCYQETKRTSTNGLTRMCVGLYFRFLNNMRGRSLTGVRALDKKFNVQAEHEIKHNKMITHPSAQDDILLVSLSLFIAMIHCLRANDSKHAKWENTMKTNRRRSLKGFQQKSYGFAHEIYHSADKHNINHLRFSDPYGRVD